ncbi:MAG: bifunctional histidinol-phosphatase/imidazoleglycerol-phosphate dehydratase HisB [Rikenellaceae bacterium]
MSGRKILFIDRDGTLIKEPAIDFQVDSLEKLEFVPEAITAMAQIAKLDYFLAMVSNQDGLGTPSYPTDTFLPAHNKMLTTLAGEGVRFDAEHIDPSFENEHSPNRKPQIGMLKSYLTGDYDIANSYVIGDRITDVKLAENLGCKAILLSDKSAGKALTDAEGLTDRVSLITNSWHEIYGLLRAAERRVEITRNTRETKITALLDLDKLSNPNISTGIGFFDHMLEQISYHGAVTLNLKCDGDLDVDAHHTVEDCGIVLGEAFAKALGEKLGINRYGFSLPMDECQAQVLIDLGGRIDFVWDVEFTVDMIGELPTEMIKHFFKSFASAAHCNLHVAAHGENNHHKAEAVFKAFARAMKCAIHREISNNELPSSKGIL